MERLTVEEVKEAYQTTGLRPRAGIWYVKNENCACALSALSISEVGEQEFLKRTKGLFSDEYTIRSVAEILRLPYRYVQGFTYGFDGIDIDETDEFIGKEFLTGYNDGKLIREAVICS